MTPADVIAADAGWCLVEGDCLAVLDECADLTFDVCLMDPPYEAEAHTKARRSLKDATQKRGAKNNGERRRIDQPLEVSFPQMSDGLRRDVASKCAVLVRGWTVAFCQIEGVSLWRAAFMTSGLEWVRGGVWRKPNGAPQFTGDRPGQGFECLAIAHPKGRKQWNGGGRHAVWDCPLDHGAGNGLRNDHPTQKPLDLMLQLVADFTNPGEVVLDPFAGSGTTGVACLRLGRRFVGIEKDPTFAALARERLAAEACGSTLQAARAGQGALFG